MLDDERRRTLGADPLDPRQDFVPRVVAHERQEVAHARRRDVEALLHNLGRVPNVLVRVVEPQAIADELRVPLVHAGNHHVVPGLERRAGVARHDVLLALHARDVESQRPQQLGQGLELRPQNLGPRGDVGLGLEHRNRPPRRLEGEHPMYGARDGEERVDRRPVATCAIGRHGDEASGEQVRSGGDHGSFGHRGASVFARGPNARGLLRRRHPRRCLLRARANAGEIRAWK